MIFILLVIALFLLAEMLFPARMENGGELMYDDYQEPQKAKRRVILDEHGRPTMYVPEDWR